MNPPPVIYWFRQDLRLADLPGLAEAVSTGAPVVPAYVLDDAAAGEWVPGSASRWWLHHSLESLAESIRNQRGSLTLHVGPAADRLMALAAETGARGIYCSRAFEPWAVQQERDVQRRAQEAGLAFERFAGSLLFEPEQIRTQSGSFYRTFTPFWKACRQQPKPAPPQPAPTQVSWHLAPDDMALEDLRLTAHPPPSAAHDLRTAQETHAAKKTRWHSLWQPGEAGATAALHRFLDQSLDGYHTGRELPGQPGTSHLSPHLHFGEISPRQLWRAIKTHDPHDMNLAVHRDRFLTQLGWRDFSHHLLHHFPALPNAPFDSAYQHFPWAENAAALAAWREGRTGYPLVDAGMRELDQTGYMHNRVRMVTASFLTKHLLQPWQAGERWFWDALVDADLANNAASWQWVAGSGADAAPYFRIFNPTLQGERFDPEGQYVRRWVPELAGLPNRHLHAPASAPEAVLKAAGVRLGATYPNPIVDHRQARTAALGAYSDMRDAAAQAR